nr:response regulator [Desulfobulbaceae bacterium]
MLNNKILIVDDDEESILMMLCKDFEEEGYEVMTAASGEEAIKKLQNSPFDIVISDLAMPGADGIAVLNEAKKTNPDIIAIILTGYGDMTSAIEALRLGADDYLLKPCDTEELLLRTTRCLAKQEAFQKVKFYENILPVCMYCKSIRDDKGSEPGKGKWMRMEEYLHQKSGTDVSHTFCPNCKEQATRDMLGD